MSSLAGKRVLVTGGAGFIGSHVVDALLDLNATVTIVDQAKPPPAREAEWQRRGVDLVRLDVSSAELPAFLATGNWHTIFHLASNAYVPVSVSDPLADFQVNLLSTFHLLECLRAKESKPRVLFASSAAVYGEPERLPIAETDRLNPISPYGVSKLAAERYMDVYARLFGLQTASLRLFSVYGERQRKQVVYDIVDKLHARPDHITLFGDGSQERDFTHVSDVVQAFLTVADRGPLRGEVYNVGSGRVASILELVREVSRLMAISPEISFTGSVRPGDPDKWAVDIGRLSAVGYRPRVTLEDGLNATIRWFREALRTPKPAATPAATPSA